MKKQPKQKTAKLNSPRTNYPKYFYLILLFIPFVFITIIEGSLRLFNYGKDLPQWIDAGNDQLTLNYDIAQRYFQNEQTAPVVLSANFDKAKKKNAFRVFVLGESSAAGYPYLPNGAFSNYLEDRLKLLYPGIPIDVVNVGITAVNSYTWLDLLPGILEQQPDAIILYGGHNEYYGVLGAASTQSFGNSRWLVKLNLWLNNFKTIQLLRNTVSKVAVFFSKKEETRGTLMAQLSKGQHVPFQSELFENGISQFENNLNEMLELAKEKNVPFLLSTIVSNIKDQGSFISSKEMVSAETIYSQAKIALAKNEIKKADSLFRYAKDLDLLRFRAPEKINSVLKMLSSKFSVPLIDADSALSNASKDNIIGNDFMTDHLHPNLRGYQLIGKTVFEVMQREKILPKTFPQKIDAETQDSLVKANFHFSQLDTLIALQRIAILKNDWPYVNAKNSLIYRPVLKTFQDTLAYAVASGKLGWGKAHRINGDYYLQQQNLSAFQKEYDVLINIFPNQLSYYEKITRVFVESQKFDEALPWLVKWHAKTPSPFSSKWLGIISLIKKNNSDAIQYLEEAKTLAPYDPDNYYYLNGAYGKAGDFENALRAINRCIELQPEYPKAKTLKEFTENEIAKRKKAVSN